MNDFVAGAARRTSMFAIIAIAGALISLIAMQGGCDSAAAALAGPNTPASVANDVVNMEGARKDALACCVNESGRSDCAHFADPCDWGTSTTSNWETKLYYANIGCSHHSYSSCSLAISSLNQILVHHTSELTSNELADGAMREAGRECENGTSDNRSLDRTADTCAQLAEFVYNLAQSNGKREGYASAAAFYSRACSLGATDSCARARELGRAGDDASSRAARAETRASNHEIYAQAEALKREEEQADQRRESEKMMMEAAQSGYMYSSRGSSAGGRVSVVGTRLSPPPPEPAPLPAASQESNAGTPRAHDGACPAEVFPCSDRCNADTPNPSLCACACKHH
jgi:hypothetical protein